jgi:hypothetical protein
LSLLRLRFVLISSNGSPPDEADTDSEFDFGPQFDDELCFTTDFEIAMDMRKKKWLAKEIQLRAVWDAEKKKRASEEEKEHKPVGRVRYR